MIQGTPDELCDVYFVDDYAGVGGCGSRGTAGACLSCGGLAGFRFSAVVIRFVFLFWDVAISLAPLPRSVQHFSTRLLATPALVGALLHRLILLGVLAASLASVGTRGANQIRERPLPKRNGHGSGTEGRTVLERLLQPSGALSFIWQ